MEARKNNTSMKKTIFSAFLFFIVLLIGTYYYRVRMYEKRIYPNVFVASISSREALNQTYGVENLNRPIREKISFNSKKNCDTLCG